MLLVRLVIECDALGRESVCRLVCRRWKLSGEAGSVFWLSLWAYPPGLVPGDPPLLPVLLLFAPGDDGGIANDDRLIYWLSRLWIS